MVRLKAQYADPNGHYVDGRRYTVVKVKRHRINPSQIAGVMSLWQVIVESLMERYPWAVIENVWGWLIYKISIWSIPKFSVPLPSSGKRISVAYRKPKQSDWVLLSTKKAQR